MTKAKLVPGLQLCQPRMARRQDGTVFFGANDRLWRLDVSGSVTDLGFGAWALSRDTQGSVYVAKSMPNATGDVAAIHTAIVRITPDDKLHDVAKLETTLEGMAVDRQGAIFLQRTRMPQAYIDQVGADGHTERWATLDRVSPAQNNWALGAFAVDSRGNLYLGALGAVVKIDATLRTPSTFVGRGQEVVGRSRDGAGSDAELGAEVTRMAIDSSDNVYIVTHSGLSWLRKIKPDGTVSTLAGGDATLYGGGNAARNDELVDGDLRGQVVIAHSTIDVDEAGNVYFLQCAVNALRRITPNGRVETLLRGPLNPPSW